MRLCKDCKHFDRYLLKATLSMCRAQREPVTGTPKHFCDISREYGPCGGDARFFEQAPARRLMFWQRPAATETTE